MELSYPRCRVCVYHLGTDNAEIALGSSGLTVANSTLQMKRLDLGVTGAM